MTVLFIILGIIFGPLLLISLLIFIGKIKVRIIFNGELSVIVSAFGIRYTVMSPKKKWKKEHPKLSKCPHSDRALQKEWKRQRKRAIKAERKRSQAALKAKQKQIEKRKKQHEKKAQASKDIPSPNLKENLEIILALLKKLGKVTQRKFHIHVRRMHLYIGTDNAADTAILYGVIVQSASYLLQWINDHAIPIHRKKDSMIIQPDYLASSCRADVDIICSVRLRSVVSIGVRMLFTFFKERKRANEKAIARHESEIKA